MSKGSGRVLQRFAACWGNGDFGRLGHGLECLSEETPRLVGALADMQISQVAAGGAHTAVLAGKPSSMLDTVYPIITIYPSVLQPLRVGYGVVSILEETPRWAAVLVITQGMTTNCGQSAHLFPYLPVEALYPDARRPAACAAARHVLRRRGGGACGT